LEAIGGRTLGGTTAGAAFAEGVLAPAAGAQGATICTSLGRGAPLGIMFNVNDNATAGIALGATTGTFGATVGTAVGGVDSVTIGAALRAMKGATHWGAWAGKILCGLEQAGSRDDMTKDVDDTSDGGSGKIVQHCLTHSPKIESWTKRSLEVTLRVAMPIRGPTGATDSATSGTLICRLPPSHA
jgi:hypothetical protein